LKSSVDSEVEPLDPPATVAQPPPSSAPTRSRSELAFFAWAALVARSVLTMAAGFITTPYLLRFLGAERLGAFRASQQWTSYLGFLYVGLGPTLIVMLLKPASRGDLAGTVGVLKSGMRITMRQTLSIVLPAGLVLAWFMPDLVGASFDWERCSDSSPFCSIRWTCSGRCSHAGSWARWSTSASPCNR
jgi:O-antigen/teichoic acid export membrane protein